MKKRKKRPADPKQNLTVVVLAIVVVLLLIATVWIIWRVESNHHPGGTSEPGTVTEPTDNTGAEATESDQMENPDNTIPDGTEAAPTERDDGIPCVLEDGKLEITSLFPYSGSNPDCYWENGENIAAIALTNHSDAHLVYAHLEMSLSDGTKLEFIVEQIPAGKTVWAFEINNATLEAAAVCESVVCTAEYAEQTDTLSDSLTVAVEGMNITLTNISADTVTNVEVTCHGVLDDVYFGGIAYTYPVGEIASGGSVSVFAQDCFAGVAEVVHITSGD